jgi:hypothetical protein
MTALFLYTEFMKEKLSALYYSLLLNKKLWTIYYYIMIIILGLGIYILIDSYFLDQLLFSKKDLGLAQTNLLTFFAMTVLRFVTIGKHFWNKP